MNNKFSENLRKIRKDNNLSQEELADEIGVSRQAISKWESGIAYPEMDKIILLCDKFNLNLDDLLHKDITEVKGEEESKKKINEYIDNFLKFITDSVNLFTHMSFMSKVKCFIEQVLIVFVLYICCGLLINVVDHVFRKVFSIFSSNITHYLIGILNAVLILGLFIVCVVIIVHIFKTRYLDYYKKSLEDKKDESSEKEEVKEEKKFSKKEESKIIIRDPKDENYGFINGLLKIIIFFIKLSLLSFACFVAFGLICLFGFFIISFLLYKTGVFFIGLILTSLSSSVIAGVILVFILNFILDRKSNKKALLVTFLISLVFFGAGCGLTFVGSLDFDFNRDINKVETREYKMVDGFMIYGSNSSNINYIESNINNVKVDYTYNKYCTLDEDINKTTKGLMVFTDCPNTGTIIKTYLKELNNKNIVNIDNRIEKIDVYASKDNIKKLKNNWNTFEEESKKNK